MQCNCGLLFSVFSRGSCILMQFGHDLDQGRTDHLETRALPEGPGSVEGPMRCPWYLFHRLF
ncbi:unnamed protein product [Staurois parvus]|uniref:Uncharacterized protein n=1 Tax=Staurois parvus TaxID=386267 RepID=A0ABN9D1S6_9NEOB|nr:unnamed protein product [Staurois parvus]